MQTKIRSISRFVVPFRSALFNHSFETVATTKGAALRIAMQAEEFAPARCFGVPKRIRVIHKIHP